MEIFKHFFRTRAGGPTRCEGRARARARARAKSPDILKFASFYKGRIDMKYAFLTDGSSFLLRYGFLRKQETGSSTLGRVSETFI